MAIEKYRAGVHFPEPLLIEAGEERRVEISLEAEAELHLVAFVLADGTKGGATNRSTDGAEQSAAEGENASKTGLSLSVDLAGEGAALHLHALYIAAGIGKKAGHTDIEVKVNHLVPDCTSLQHIKGIAAGEATGAFSGLVHVAVDAQRTHAEQRNQNLQLSDTAHVFTRPQLEIYADDVKCSHGATVGRLDEEAIYYMRQRGVSEAEARRLQIQGFVGEITGHIPDESSREAIGAKIEHLLGRL